MNQPFIAWIKFQRRANSMQSYFKQTNYYVTTNFSNSAKLKIVDYALKSLKTIRILLLDSSSIVWIQLPPSFIVELLLLYNTIFKKKKIICDCHNGLFLDKWLNFLSIQRLNKMDLIIVHNHVIYEIALKLGVDKKKLRVLETRPTPKSGDIDDSNFSNNTINKLTKDPFVVVPCSFNPDEPIQTILDAASLSLEVPYLITGSKKKAGKLIDLSNLPENVYFTGYLTTHEYEQLLSRAAVVLGLTTEHHIQLSVANEAVGYGVPMVLSNTQLLKELFYLGAVYVDTLNPKSIANGINQAIDNNKKLRSEIPKLRQEREEKWLNQAKLITEYINRI